MDINCPICYDQYSDKDKVPRILPCGHTFCQVCLLDLRTSNILTCPTCRKFFQPEVKSLIKNFTLLDYIYNRKDPDVDYTGVTNNRNMMDNQRLQMLDPEESQLDKFCLLHPQKKTKYFCENDQTYICSKCVVGDHKGHQISDQIVESQPRMDPILKKKNILKNKIAASITETEIFEEDILEIEEQLQQEQENTISELEEKLELMIEMLKNRRDVLSKAVNQHYRKQDLYLLEAKKNIERRKNNLEKVTKKVDGLQEGKTQTESKLERLSDEFINLNKTFDSSFHQFKHCSISLNPQIANQMFEQIGSLKYPTVQFSNANAFLSNFNNKIMPITKCIFFGDSNNQNLILQYEFEKDLWSRKEVPQNLILQSYSISIGLVDNNILITGGLNSCFTNVSGSVFMYNTETGECSEKDQLMQSRYTHALAYHGNYVYAIGGRSINGVLESCERYSINMNRWEKIADLNQKRCSMPAIVFEDSYIFIFGGYEGSGRMSSIEQYDVTHDQWSILPVKFPLSIEAQSATLISSSEVIILGGHDNSAGTKDAMMLNLETMKFVQLNSMPYARFLHVTHFFKNSVYVFGGVDNCSCQKMNVNDFRWQQISPYKDFISYNLQTFSNAGV